MITARSTRHGTHFQNVKSHHTTAIDIKPIADGFTVIIESWRNSNPHKPYYSHRTHARDRVQALNWVRTMLPLPIMA